MPADLYGKLEMLRKSDFTSTISKPGYEHLPRMFTVLGLRREMGSIPWLERKWEYGMLEERLRAIQACYNDRVHWNEKTIKQGIILPIFRDLGWNVFDVFGEFRPDYTIRSVQVDYALLGKSYDIFGDNDQHPFMFIEVHSPKDSEDYRSRKLDRVLDCAHENGVKIVLVVDEDDWCFYRTSIKGSAKRRFSLMISFRSEPDFLVTMLSTLLAKNVLAGAIMDGHGYTNFTDALLMLSQKGLRSEELETDRIALELHEKLERETERIALELHEKFRGHPWWERTDTTPSKKRSQYQRSSQGLLLRREKVDKKKAKAMKAMFENARDEVGEEIWQPNELKDLKDMDSTWFLGQYCHVVFTSGFRYSTVKKHEDATAKAFQGFDLEKLAAMPSIDANDLPIKHQAKADSFLKGAKQIAAEGFDSFKARLAEDGIKVIEKLPFMGPVTKYHLAMILGIDVAKPDIWLERCAEECEVTFDELIDFLTKKYGLTKQQVDAVLWTYCEQNQEPPPTKRGKKHGK